MKKKTKTTTNKSGDKVSLVPAGSRFRFGKERKGVIRRFKSFMKRIFRPETVVEDDSLWMLFRVKESKAMKIAKEIADTIETEFDREEGVQFLDAFNTVCLACTPDCINKIIKMMFRKPVYFERKLGSDVIKWMASLPSIQDSSFEVTSSPIKVEYLTEYCIRANILTQNGPYISAKFTTTHDIEKAHNGTISTTAGLYEIYISAGEAFQNEWELPGVFKYSTEVTIKYTNGIGIGKNMPLLMEVTRRCVYDTMVTGPLWSGYFGEDKPMMDKKSKPYYQMILWYPCSEFPDKIEDMVKRESYDVASSVVQFSGNPILYAEDGTKLLADDTSNFKILKDELGDVTKNHAFTIMVYPPLEERPKKPVINPVLDLHRSTDNYGKESAIAEESEDLEYVDEDDTTTP